MQVSTNFLTSPSYDSSTTRIVSGFTKYSVPSKKRMRAAALPSVLTWSSRERGIPIRALIHANVPALRILTFPEISMKLALVLSATSAGSEAVPTSGAAWENEVVERGGGANHDDSGGQQPVDGPVPDGHPLDVEAGAFAVRSSL